MSLVGNIVKFFNPFSNKQEEIAQGIITSLTEDGSLNVYVDLSSCSESVGKMLGQLQVISRDNPHVKILEDKVSKISDVLDEAHAPGIQNLYDLCKPNPKKERR